MIGPDPDLPTSAHAGHPSYLELDRLFLMAGRATASSPGEEADAAALHVRDCVRCKEYLTALQHRAAAPLPAWVSARPTRPPSRWAQILESLRRPSFFPVAATAAAGLALLVLVHGGSGGRTQPATSTEPPSPAESVREKGGPVVAVFIKRGEQVLRWDGHARLRAQDRIRLQVAGAGYAQVTVALEQPGGAQVLYAGELAGAAPTALPGSWQVSAEGKSEILAVILSPQRLPAAPLDVAALRQQRELWVTELVMEKEASR